MIETTQMVWIHVPKTGGTWLRKILASAPASWQPVVHPGHARLPEVPLNGRRPWCIVRNPWDWHVSLFAFWRQHYFDRTGAFLLTPARWSAVERSAARLMEESRGVFKRALDIVINQGRYNEWPSEQFLLRYLWGTEDLGHIERHSARFESLRPDVLEQLRLCGHTPPFPLARRLERLGRINHSRRAALESYYDAESSRWVERANEELIDIFGYERPW